MDVAVFITNLLSSNSRVLQRAAGRRGLALKRDDHKREISGILATWLQVNVICIKPCCLLGIRKRIRMLPWCGLPLPELLR